MKKHIVGQHVLIDFYNCDNKKIQSAKRIKRISINAAKVANAKIVKAVFHEFSPHGASGVVIIKESHLAIHTWPELNAVAVDLFTCGSKMKIKECVTYLKKEFGAKKIEKTTLNRCHKLTFQKNSIQKSS